MNKQTTENLSDKTNNLIKELKNLRNFILAKEGVKQAVVNRLKDKK